MSIDGHADRTDKDYKFTLNYQNYLRSKICVLKTLQGREQDKWRNNFLDISVEEAPR